MEETTNNFKKRILMLFLFYISTLILMTIFGFAGNTSSETNQLALKYFSSTEIETGKNFFRYSLIPWTVYRITIISILFYLIYSNKHMKAVDWINDRFKNNFLRLLVSTGILYLFVNLLRLPFKILTGFVRDRYFQLSDIDFLTWLTRHSASALISILMVSLSISLILHIISRTKKYIFYIPVIFVILALTISVIYPRTILPLFYKTEKISDPVLKDKIVKLVEKAGLKNTEIYVINKSKYRLSANAFFTGTGPRREIYIYDTLLKKFNHDEIIMIIAHELVHYNEEHVLKGVLMGAVGLLLFLPLLNLFAVKLFNRDIKWFAIPEGLPALLFTLTIILYFIKPVENTISRIMERRADLKSLELIDNREVFVGMETKLAEINRSNILPNPVFAFFHYSHPPVLERIGSAEIFINAE